MRQPALRSWSCPAAMSPGPVLAAMSAVLFSLLCGRVLSCRYAGELDPGRDAELAEDLAQVEGDRVHADEHLVGDLAVGESLGDELGHRALGSGEAGLAGRRPGLDRPVPSAAAEPA